VIRNERDSYYVDVGRKKRGRYYEDVIGSERDRGM